MEAKNEKILPWQFSIQNGSIKFAKFGKKNKNLYWNSSVNQGEIIISTLLVP